MIRISATCDWSILFASFSSARVSLVRGSHPRHVDRLRVMGDHPLHELDVRHRVEHAFGDRDVAMVAHVHAGHRPLCLRGGRGAGKYQPKCNEGGSGEAREIHRSAAATVGGKGERRGKDSRIRWGLRPLARYAEQSPKLKACRLRAGGLSRSLAGRRLPKFYLVSFGIDDPCKRAVFGIVDLVENVAAFFA